jgi:Na+/alanine symporter
MWITGLVLATLTAFVIIGGIKSIAKVVNVSFHLWQLLMCLDV